MAQTAEDNSVSIVVLDNDLPGPPTAIGVPWNEESQRPNMTVAGLGVDKSNSITTVQGGTATISQDRKTITYSPEENFNGVDSFTYFVSDGEATNGVSLVSATVTVTVTPVNDNPVALDNEDVNILEDTPTLIDVLANDNGGPADENQALTIHSFTQPAHGTVSLENNQLRYAPAKDYFGDDSFQYTAIDSEGAESNLATVTILVANTNDDPLANPDQLLALKNFLNQELDVLPNDTWLPDPVETLTIISVGSNPEGNDGTTTEGGTVTISAGKVLYTPKADFESGTTGPKDTFTYTISDGHGGTSTATVEVDVLEAVPTDISGVIYLDVNNNGVRDPQEIELAGVEVTLTGTNLRGVPVDQTVKTDVNGVFKFLNILPNVEGDTVGYKITAATPKFLIDGIDSIVNPNVEWNDVDNDGIRDANELYNPGVAHNDQFTGIDLGLFGTQAAKEELRVRRAWLVEQVHLDCPVPGVDQEGLGGRHQHAGRGLLVHRSARLGRCEVGTRPTGERSGQLPADDRGRQRRRARPRRSATRSITWPAIARPAST